MNWTVRARRMGCAVAILALAACGTGPAPNDVAQGVGFQDYHEYQTRRAALRTQPAVTPVVPQTALPPAEVVAEPFAPPPVGTQTGMQWPAAEPAPATGGSVDVARIAAGAIAAAEGGTTSDGTRPATTPQQMATAPSADNFVAPPLPEGMSVLGATVVAFALSTNHAVGQRVYSRFPIRLGRPEVRCSDFRTTDLAQDWFLTNDGPERDRAGLDPDGDGFACNWSPERYRAEARAAMQSAAAQPFVGFPDG
jgi:hypothetical protein